MAKTLLSHLTTTSVLIGALSLSGIAAQSAEGKGAPIDGVWDATLNAKLPQAVNLNAWPTSFFIGRDGRAHGAHVGFPSRGSGDFDKQARAQIDHEVATLLAEKG